jgi:retron-type reverse transcriptase
MKRIGNLYTQIISIENLQQADINARKKKQHTWGVRVHDRNREANILALHQMLKDKTFRTSKYTVYTIHEEKEREVYRLPYYPDRILHHALMIVLEPIWKSIFTGDTYACIKDRGILPAHRKLRRALRHIDETPYCLKIDTRKFYPSIDHDILKQIIRKKIKCSDTLELLDHLIDSAPGVPIGNYVSQFFANLYFAYLDHYLREELNVKYYIRYADDMVFLHSDKAYLHDLLKKIDQYFTDNLKLTLKDNYQVFPVRARGVNFLGYVSYHTHIRLRKKIKQNLCRVTAKLDKCDDITDKEYMRRIAPWWGWAKYCDSKHLLKKILRPSVWEVIKRMYNE